MKRIIGLLIICFICDLVEAQVLNQDAEGNSSIVWPGGSIGINTKDELFEFNYYTPYNNSNGKIWGFDLQGKNSSGIGDLFTDGDFSPQAELSVLGGYHFSRIKVDEYIDSKEEYLEMKKYLENLKTDNSRNFYNFFAERKQALLNDNRLAIPDPIKTTLENLNESKLGIMNPSEIPKVIRDKINFDNANQRIKKVLEDFISEISTNEYLENYIMANELLEVLSSSEVVSSFNNKGYSTKTLLYIRAGLNVQEFKYDNRTETGIFKDRFVDTSFTSLLGQIGITHRRKNTFFGLNIGYEGINTFSALKKAEYSYMECQLP